MLKCFIYLSYTMDESHENMPGTHFTTNTRNFVTIIREKNPNSGQRDLGMFSTGFIIIINFSL